MNSGLAGYGLARTPHALFTLVLFKYHGFGTLRLAGTKGCQENHTNEQDDSYHGKAAYKGRITLSNLTWTYVGQPEVVGVPRALVGGHLSDCPSSDLNSTFRGFHKLLPTCGDSIPRRAQSEILDHPNVTTAGHTLDCQFAAVWSGDRPGSPRSALVPERRGVAFQVHMQEG